MHSMRRGMSAGLHYQALSKAEENKESCELNDGEKVAFIAVSGETLAVSYQAML